MDRGDWDADVEALDALELLIGAASRWAMAVELEAVA
jgi:hypothetical protein